MNTLQIERLLKEDLKTKNILKKSVLWISWKNLLFRLLTSSTRTRVVNLENIGLRFILTNVEEENILTVMDYPLHWSVSTLTWMLTPHRDGFTIAKPYRHTFPVLWSLLCLFYFISLSWCTFACYCI